MPVDHKERAFEAAIEHHLLNVAGYAKADPANFDRERALDPTVLIPFIKETQPETWKSLENLHGAEIESVLLDDLCKALDSPQGSLGVRCANGGSPTQGFPPSRALLSRRASGRSTFSTVTIFIIRGKVGLFTAEGIGASGDKASTTRNASGSAPSADQVAQRLPRFLRHCAVQHNSPSEDVATCPLEASPMPPNHGVGLDDHQAATPACPQS